MTKAAKSTRKRNCTFLPSKNKLQFAITCCHFKFNASRTEKTRTRESMRLRAQCTMDAAQQAQKKPIYNNYISWAGSPSRNATYVSYVYKYVLLQTRNPVVRWKILRSNCSVISKGEPWGTPSHCTNRLISHTKVIYNETGRLNLLDFLLSALSSFRDLFSAWPPVKAKDEGKHWKSTNFPHRKISANGNFWDFGSRWISASSVES